MVFVFEMKTLQLNLNIFMAFFFIMTYEYVDPTFPEAFSGLFRAGMFFSAGSPWFLIPQDSIYKLPPLESLLRRTWHCAPKDNKLHESKVYIWAKYSSLLYPQCLPQYISHSRPLRYICWMNKWKRGKRGLFAKKNKPSFTYICIFKQPQHIPKR